jgi:hypothetical protein
MPETTAIPSPHVAMLNTSPDNNGIPDAEDAKMVVV